MLRLFALTSGNITGTLETFITVCHFTTGMHFAAARSLDYWRTCCYVTQIVQEFRKSIELYERARPLCIKSTKFIVDSDRKPNWAH
jgi:hypothetical protein